MLTEQGQYEKIEEFGLMPFPVNVLHANRTFCESFVVGKSAAGRRECKVPKWDGRAAERIWEILMG